jgi:hypothetical protein
LLINEIQDEIFGEKNQLGGPEKRWAAFQVRKNHDLLQNEFDL